MCSQKPRSCFEFTEAEALQIVEEISLTAERDEARAVFAEAQRLHAAGDVRGGLEAAKGALSLDPDLVEALEFAGTALVARHHRFAEGLALIDRAVALRPDDAGLWYARGWNYEFAAHETRRRPPRDEGIVDPRVLYEEAATSFRRCLALHPEGKLVGDAEDLLDHIKNELLGCRYSPHALPLPAGQPGREPRRFRRSTRVSIVERYVELHPTSKHLAARASTVFPDGVTHDVRHNEPFPLYVARGRRQPEDRRRRQRTHRLRDGPRRAPPRPQSPRHRGRRGSAARARHALRRVPRGRDPLG